MVQTSSSFEATDLICNGTPPGGLATASPKSDLQRAAAGPGQLHDKSNLKRVWQHLTSLAQNRFEAARSQAGTLQNGFVEVHGSAGYAAKPF